MEKALRLPRRLRTIVILSHDCDILRGNDHWTQMIRFYRMLSPVLKGKAPDFHQLSWIGENLIHPRRYYFDDVSGYMELERAAGFQSVFYALNGRHGRFGARSGSQISRELASFVTEPFELGMHYNHDTFLNPSAFELQRKTLETWSGRPIRSGRAHYLRFDPLRSPAFLENQGIQFDESVGFPDRIGFRMGIAGVIRLFDVIHKSTTRTLECPIAVMDSALVHQFGKNSVATFEELVRHIAHVGGIVSLLFHPGCLRNPEYPELNGLYPRLLDVLAKHGFESTTPSRMIAEVRAYEALGGSKHE
ncbi:MAG: hypothetical protein V1495_06790 [Pseudomonadota bacterium]